MSNTRNKHSFVQKTKMEESNRLTFVVLIFAILIGLYGVFNVNLGGDNPVSENEVKHIDGTPVLSSKLPNILDIQEIGNGNGKFRFEIKDYDNRKSYYMDLGDGKIVKVKRKVFSHRYTSNGFFKVNLMQRNSKGKMDKLFNEIITINRGS